MLAVRRQVFEVVGFENLQALGHGGVEVCEVLVGAGQGLGAGAGVDGCWRRRFADLGGNGFYGGGFVWGEPIPAHDAEDCPGQQWCDFFGGGFLRFCGGVLGHLELLVGVSSLGVA